MKQLAPVLLFSSLLGSILPAQSTETLGNVTFRVPKSYVLTHDKEGFDRVRTEEGPNWLELRVLAGTKLTGKVEDHVDGFLQQVQKSNPTEYRIDVPRSSKTPRNAERVSSAAASAQNPNAPGTYSYFVVWCYLAGSRVETIVLNTNSPELYAKQQPVVERFLNGIRLASAQVLAEGTPPLTQFGYERTLGFVEWLLEIPMTDTQRTAIRMALLDGWEKNDRETIDGTTQLVEGVDELAGKTEDEKRVVRVMLRDKALAEWRKSKESVEQMLAGIWDAAHQPVVAGDPPLTQQVCDATAEAYFLMACAVAGVTMKTPEKDLLTKWTELLKSRYAELPKESREALQQMPVFAAALRVAWPQLPEDQKRQHVEQWKGIPGIPELGKQISANSMKNLLDLQARVQANNMYYQTMSNMLRMQHETSMTIIRNMGSSNWHYEYRYR